jgi:hypothetical protein
MHSFRPAFVVAALAALAALAAGRPAAGQDPGAAAPTGTVTGLVLDPRGAPMVAAEVWCAPSGDPTARLARSRTDGDGFFVLTGVPADGRTCRVHATAPDHALGSAWVTLSGPEDTEHESLTLWAAADVHGRVVGADGAPLAGAEVIATHDAARVFGFDPLASARSDGEGRFELRKVPLGEIQVRAWRADRQVGETTFWHRGARDDVAVTVPDGAGVTLEVRVHGLPAGQEARVSMLGYARGGYVCLPMLRSGATDGGVWRSTGLPDLRYEVSATADAHSFQPRSQHAEAGAAPHRLEFRAVADATNVVRGLLVDPAGAVFLPPATIGAGAFTAEIAPGIPASPALVGGPLFVQALFPGAPYPGRWRLGNTVCETITAF